MRSADALLQCEAEKIKRHHVEDEVHEIRMHEPARDRCLVLLATQEPVRSKHTLFDYFARSEQAKQTDRGGRN